MVSPTPVLPVLPSCSSSEDNPRSGSLDVRHDAVSTLTFASHLNQRMTHSAPARNLPDADTKATSEQAKADADATSPADASTASEPDEETEKTSSEKDEARPDKTVSADASPAASDATRTSEAIAASALITPLVSVLPGVPTAPIVANNADLPGDNPPVPVSPGNMPTADTTASGPSSITPLVAMDSRAAIVNAAPGVDNASPIPPLPAATINPTNVPNVAQTNIGMPGTNVPNTAALNSADVQASLTPATQPTSAAIVSTAAVSATAGTPITAVTGSGSPDASATTITAGANPGANAATASALTGAVSSTLPASIGATTSVVDNSAQSSPTAQNTAQNTAQTGTAQSNAEATLEATAPIAAGREHLSSVERWLTLNNAKSAAVTPTTGSDREGHTPNAAGGRESELQAAPALPNTVPARPNAPAFPNAALSGTFATATTPGTQPSDAAIPALSTFGNTSVPDAVMQTLHGTVNTQDSNRTGSLSSAGIPVSGTIGAGSAPGSPLATLIPSAFAAGNNAAGEEGEASEQNNAHSSPDRNAAATANTSSSDTAAAFSSTRASGDAPVTAPSTSATANGLTDRAHVVEQVTRHLETMRLTNGNGEMRLHLNPQNLGSVQVTVAAHQDGVVARIAVESAQVQQVMEGAKEHLRAGLEARGLHVQTVEVTVTPNLLGENPAAFSDRRHWQSAFAQESGLWQSGSAWRPGAPVQSVPAVASNIITARPLPSDSRLDCRA